ncbi:MAG: hypothetical protein H7070_14030 [Saprospiraceae bacterium]|nr:hypothetical protein [Pyrinomonadaceae bacterium]
MTISEILIVYLSLGAPFAVYQFLQDRKISADLVIIRSVLQFLLWLPIAIHAGLSALISVTSTYIFANGNRLDAKEEERIRHIQEMIADSFRKGEQNIPVREFCGILDRYIGLSILVRDGRSIISGVPNELLAISGHKNTDLAAICLNRRNRSRLGRHQIDARTDFLDCIAECSFANRDIIPPALDLAEFLEDARASKELTGLLDKRTSDVRKIDKLQADVWIPEIQPSKSEQSPVNL